MGIETELKQFADGRRKDIRKAAELLLNEELPPITEELFGLYEKNGNRIIYERVYFTRRRFLAVYGLEALVQIQQTGYVEKCILDKLSRVIVEICQEECWALPPPVDRTEENWQVTVDLFASSTAQALAELSDRLKMILPDEVMETIKENVEKRVFSPFFTSAIPYRKWENSMHNWNGVCAGAIGSACLHLMEDGVRLEACLKRICDGLQYYLKGFEEDGACTEGLGYYTYGMTYFCNFAQELYDRTNGEYDLFNGSWGICEGGPEDKRRKIATFIAKCFFTDGRTLSFADGGSRGTFRMGLGCILAMHYPEFKFPDMKRAAGFETDGCYNFASLKVDLLMPERLLVFLSENSRRNTVALDSGMSETDILPKAQWVIARSAVGICMACKGGHNKEFHNHNDVGHFIYEGMGTLFFTDLGSGEYKKGYFGEGRYQVLCNRSLGHSVPIVNGKEQLEGRAYACSDFQAVSQNGTVTVKMDISGAYEKESVRKLERCLNFCIATGRLQVTDEFYMYGKPGECVEENLITQIPPVVEENRVLLYEGTKVCTLTFQQKNAICVEEYEHSNHKGIKEKVYAIRWKVDLIKGIGTNTFCLSISDRDAVG